MNDRNNKQLVTDNELLMVEWNYERNNAENISPNGLLAGSHKRVWWKCDKCGYEWQSAVNKRAIGRHKCPACVGQALHKGSNDLATQHLELVPEWDYGKNHCKPDEVISGSGKEAWWKCKKCGYEWKAKIRDRSSGHGCPACVNQVVWKGHNDLATVFPDIAAEWNKERNKIDASEVVFGSAKKAWWKCSRCGHQWNAAIVSRTTNGNGCPKCASRLQTSFQEQAMFYYLSHSFDDAESRFVGALDDGTELDIYIPSLKVGVEYDGQNWHSSERALTLERRKYQNCKAAGITLYRVREDEASENTCDISILCDYKRGHYDALTEAIRQLFSALKVEQDVDVARDAQVIREQYYNYLKGNSLAQIFPEVAIEWNEEKNGGITPSMVFAKTGEKFWWKCKKCGYEWRARVADRTSRRQRGCPACANKTVWVGHNDLATKYPELCKEWDYEKNEALPSEITPGCNRKFWWKCRKCGYSWEVSPNKRVGGRGCPACANRVTWTGHTDLATKYPEVSKKWHPTKNSEITPETVAPYSHKKAWWIDKDGKEYERRIDTEVRLYKKLTKEG